MTVCRYFLQGKCRFGDRCRFEHIDPDYSYQEETPRRGNYHSYSNRGSYNNYSNQGSYNYSNRGSYNDGNRWNNKAYEDRTYYNDYTPRRNNYTSFENQHQSDYNQYNQHYSYGRYGPGTYESDSSYGQKNKFGQNKHEWVSDDYRKHRGQQRSTEEFYNTSTPKSSTSFSFKEPRVETKTEHPVDLHMNDQNVAYAELIKEEMNAWELGSQWPISCYSPVLERSNFPGFTDVSPEELRYDAYKARENNTYDSYVQSVEKAIRNINTRRNLLKNPSLELMSIIEKYRSGQDISAENEIDGASSPLYTSQAHIEDMIADESSVQQSSSSFSFKQVPQSSVKTASNFSFKLPQSESKLSSQVVNSQIYTPLEELSTADKEQFSASTFNLGRIPTVPPPQEMCF